MATEEGKKQPLIKVHERGGLVVGLRDGNLVSINDVVSGLACNCTCPNPLCGDRLVAHRGDEIAWHFKHHNKKECRAGFESALHMLAKDALAEALEFRLPPFTRGLGLNREEITAGRMMKFDRAELEKRTGRIVPDVVLYVGETPLLVELVVTHWCDQTKIDLMKVGSLSCVEVDLGPYREIWDMDTLRDIVVAGANRWWRNNKYAEDKANRIDAARKAERDKRVADHVAKLKHFYKAVGDRADREVKFTDTSILKALDLGRGIGIEVPGDTCFPDRVGWQKTIIEHLLREGTNAFSSHNGVPFKTVFGWVKAYVDPKFPEWPTKDIRDDVIDQVPEFVSSYDVVRAYLNKLVDIRFVTTFNNRWAFSERLRQQIRNERKQVGLREERHALISGLVHAVLDEVPDAEKSGFEYETWLDLVCELNRSPREIIDEECIVEQYLETIVRDNEDYAELKTGIGRVRNMLTGRGRIVDDHFNLPVKRRIPDLLAAEAFEAEQAEERRKLQLFQAGQAREKRLINELKWRYPGHDVETLISERMIDGVPVYQAVRADEGTYPRALNALAEELDASEQAARLRREEEDRVRRIEALKQNLLTRCDRVNGTPAGPFVSHDSQSRLRGAAD